MIKYIVFIVSFISFINVCNAQDNKKKNKEKKTNDDVVIMDFSKPDGDSKDSSPFPDVVVKKGKL